ncbi:B3 domain-containing transcription factor VRN1 [Senna tora]|uniref:B3 domain-containing transcription factor VRN1 n=1 Tax=Senna tora TaxID=362788 RepID=A0A834T4C1_9FABA|nr:B3 domain-containing transcription factor VRN1 [Senna tora]
MSSSQGHHEKAIHFFKIILPKSMQDGELRIPKSFVRKYWKKGLSKSKAVVFRVPNGAKWEVEWIERDGDIWLRNGWENFANFYSIGDGHFLVFRYEGGNKFGVMVFGMSGLEIEYPPKGRVSVRSKNIIISDEDDDVPEEVKLEQKSDDDDDDDDNKIRSHQPPKKMKTNHSNGTNTNPTKTRGSDGVIERCMISKMEGRSAIERAKKFRSEKPFFICKMRPTYLHRNFLIIPRHFSVTYLEGMEGKARIRVCGETMRSWEVKYKYFMYNKHCVFTSGWDSFAKYNDLEEGDACVFEMIHHHAPPQQLSFQVVIFRSTSSSNLQTQFN